MACHNFKTSEREQYLATNNDARVRNNLSVYGRQQQRHVDANMQGGGRNEEQPSPLESFVRQLTPYKEYHFGDLTKTATKTTVNATKTAAQNVGTLVQRKFDANIITKSAAKNVASKAISLE
eukprot:10564028-Ditylum_brightwellii.AAC.1